jgi:aminoglycoside phosphotransferase family enzyme
MVPSEPKTRLDREVDIRAKVAFLTCPEAYPDRPERVEAKETHMSWVFLTDAHAYKLKKPVRYAFLDFSTVEARRRDCEQEVRLNRRFAGDVYCGTVLLNLDPEGRLHLDGKGRTVDCLVKMRRLPAERTLEHAIAAHAVREEDVRGFAARLAALYRDSPPIEIKPQEYHRRFHEDLNANRRELARPAFGLPLELIEEIAAAQLHFLKTERALLDQRVREKRIVEGHGDLRPEHIYLGRRPVIMDCLEFKRDFRILDPADELAFLAMECDRLGAPFVGGWVFETYGEVTGDEPPGKLVQFYMSCRAYLRAKIAIWHLDEPDVRDPSKWPSRTREYLHLARSYAERFD